MQEFKFECSMSVVYAMILLYMSYYFLSQLLVQSTPVTKSKKTQTKSTTIVLTIPKGMIHVCCMSHINGDKLIRLINLRWSNEKMTLIFERTEHPGSFFYQFLFQVTATASSMAKI